MTTATATSPRKRPLQDRARVTVDAILEATARVLVREGYDRASTNRIARTAGVSIGSLYQYFPSKEALVAALADRHIAEMERVLDRALCATADAPLPDVARALVKAAIDAHRVDPELHAVLEQQVPHARLHEVEHAMKVRLRAFLEARRDELRGVDLDVAAFVLVHLVESVAHAAVVEEPDMAGERLIDEVTALVTRWLVPG